MFDYLFINNSLQKYEKKNPKVKYLTTIFNFIIVVAIACCASYLAYKANIHYNYYWRVVMAVIGFMFSGIYLVFYFFYHVIFEFGHNQQMGGYAPQQQYRYY